MKLELNDCLVSILCTFEILSKNIFKDFVVCNIGKISPVHNVNVFQGIRISGRNLLKSSKSFKRDNSKFDENGRKFSQRVENGHYEQFLLFPHCFQKTSTAVFGKGLMVFTQSFTQVCNLQPVALKFCL